MNLTQMVGRAKRESGRQGPVPASQNTAVAEDLRIYDWVQDEWRNLQTEGVPWRFMRRSVVAPLPLGTWGYTHVQLGLDVAPLRWLPQTRDYQPTIIDGSTEWRLRFLEYDLFRNALMRTGAAAGTPQCWTVDPQGLINIGPQPDRALSLSADYLRGVTVLSDAPDSPIDLPEQFHMLLVWGAVQQIAGFDAATEVVLRAQANWQQLRTAFLNNQAPAWRTALS